MNIQNYVVEKRIRKMHISEDGANFSLLEQVANLTNVLNKDDTNVCTIHKIGFNEGLKMCAKLLKEDNYNIDRLLEIVNKLKVSYGFIMFGLYFAYGYIEGLFAFAGNESNIFLKRWKKDMMCQMKK